MKNISIIVATIFAALAAVTSCESQSAYQTQLDSARSAINHDDYIAAFAQIDEIFNGAQLSANDAISGLQLSLTAYKLSVHSQGQNKDLTTNIDRCKKIAEYLQKAKLFPQEEVAQANKVVKDANNGTDIIDSTEKLVASLPELEAELSETLRKAAVNEPNTAATEIPSKTN